MITAVDEMLSVQIRLIRVLFFLVFTKLAKYSILKYAEENYENSTFGIYVHFAGRSAFKRPA
jgi:hypothetical protein